MNKEIKEQWIKALRSGNYQQCKNYLNREDKEFCCLGVLCEISNLKKSGSEVKSYTDSFFASSVTYLPNAFRDKIEITGEQEARLIRMNDNGVSFNEIAKYIDENL